MSQRLLMHLSDASRERDESLGEVMTITQRLDTARDISKAVRTQFEQKSSAPVSLTIPDIESVSSSEEDVVQVRIERTVKIEGRKRSYKLEDYSRGGRRL
ncbi:hypothetical protein BDN72DRAFT_812325 [Pluteus cervinus]|uniref:Uncharacterized protein n=1 Tax=Pluteus cervinus TaxID=181527 RepID=A0ACD3B916_9AGAR|nr:hypothetical protein BDN72DRAFT_812325 [Pluteus cervinus]